jgi:hypothetical protein
VCGIELFSEIPFEAGDDGIKYYKAVATEDSTDEEVLQIREMLQEYKKENPQSNIKSNYGEHGLAVACAFQFNFDGSVSMILEEGQQSSSTDLTLEQAKQKFIDIIKAKSKYGFYHFEFLYMFKDIEESKDEYKFPKFFTKAIQAPSFIPDYPGMIKDRLTARYYYIPDIFNQELWSKDPTERIENIYGQLGCCDNEDCDFEDISREIFSKFLSEDEDESESEDDE